MTDFNNFSFNLILFVAKGKSKEKALLRINHLIDMAGMAIENKCFHDVFAFSAALNDITIQSLCKKYKFSESRRKILERLNIVTNEYDNCMNLHHITFEDAIPSLNVYAGQVGKGKEMSGAGVSLFKSGLISLQKSKQTFISA
ncbi:Uncharacterised protein [Legionella hackeliae]|nr:Uncharacterised protein [Legionella hackeliae]